MALKVKSKTEELPCRLTDEEVQLKSAALANAVEAMEAERDAQKEAKTEMKARMQELSNNVAELAHQVNRREETRLVEVEIQLIPNSMLVQEVRTDTGEIVATRKADPDELQTSLDD